MAKDTSPLATPATPATPPAYSEAVKIARRFLESWMAGKSKGLAAGKNLADPRDWRAMNSEVLGAAMLRKRPCELVAWASADREGWDALRLGLANAIDRGDEIPPEALQWLARHLRGEIESPNGTAGTNTAEALHVAIFMAVHMLAQKGMKPTRNDASAPTSACDVVAEALAGLGCTPATFDGVKRVWQSMKKNTKPGIPAT